MRGINVRLVVGFLGVMLSWSFVAEARNPVGTGNYRRREAIKAAFKIEGRYSRFAQYCTVKGIDTVLNHSAKWYQIRRKLPTSSRILAVANGQTGKVVLVKAPNDPNKPVRKLTTKEANRYGLITQHQAMRLASRNGGAYGRKGKVRVVPNGLSSFGDSFSFKQASHLKTSTGYRGRQTLQTIERHVPITGQAGETAVPGGSWSSLGSKIRYARSYDGVSQKELARKVGVSAATVSKWERGLKPVPQAKLPALLRVLGHRL